jgi:hypothetical protein
MESTNKIRLAIPFNGLLIVIDASGTYLDPTFSVQAVVDFDMKEFEKYITGDVDFCTELLSQFREKFLIRNKAMDCYLERGYGDGRKENVHIKT